MIPLIYNAKFNTKEKTTHAMAWISFPDLKPTHFVKEYLFLLAFTVDKPIHIDMATVSKTRPSCARVKMHMDIMDDLPKYVEMEIMNSITEEARVEKVKNQYDFLLKYYTRCTLQAHNVQEC